MATADATLAELATIVRAEWNCGIFVRGFDRSCIDRAGLLLWVSALSEDPLYRATWLAEYDRTGALDAAPVQQRHGW